MRIQLRRPPPWRGTFLAVNYIHGDIVVVAVAKELVQRQDADVSAFGEKTYLFVAQNAAQKIALHHIGEGQIKDRIVSKSELMSIKGRAAEAAADFNDPGISTRKLSDPKGLIDSLDCAIASYTSRCD